MNDPDDELPPVTLVDIYWHYANRWAEWGMGVARSFGWKETKMILRCEAVGCVREATGRTKFLDPRRGHGNELAYVVRHYCCDECMLKICDELERQANYARIVN